MTSRYNIYVTDAQQPAPARLTIRTVEGIRFDGWTVTAEVNVNRDGDLIAVASIEAECSLVDGEFVIGDMQISVQFGDAVSADMFVAVDQLVRESERVRLEIMFESWKAVA